MLYVEPTTKADAAALASAVKRAGNIVVAAQLTAGATSEDAVEWLRPLQDIESSAAGVGHVDVHTGFDGVARTLSDSASEGRSKERSDESCIF